MAKESKIEAPTAKDIELGKKHLKAEALIKYATAQFAAGTEYAEAFKQNGAWQAAVEKTPDQVTYDVVFKDILSVEDASAMTPGILKQRAAMTLAQALSYLTVEEAIGYTNLKPEGKLKDSYHKRVYELGEEDQVLLLEAYKYALVEKAITSNVISLASRRRAKTLETKFFEPAQKKAANQ